LLQPGALGFLATRRGDARQLAFRVLINKKQEALSKGFGFRHPDSSRVCGLGMHSGAKGAQHHMTITLVQLLIWILIAAVVGVIGELIVGRRGPHGIIGATLLGWLAIFLIVGVFHFHISGEPVWEGVPILSSIIAAAVLAALYSFVLYRPVAAR